MSQASQQFSNFGFQQDKYPTAGFDPFNKPTKLRVVNLMMAETGTYNQQFVRPYATSLDAHSLNALTEKVVNSGAETVAGHLSGLTSTFLSPTATAESTIMIANGWNERRVRFMLAIEVEHSVGGTVMYYLQGYTDHLGVSASHYIDPNMVFIINSITSVNIRNVNTPYGVKQFQVVNDSSHLLCDPYSAGMYGNAPTIGMRPSDVFAMMQTSADNDVSSEMVGSSIIDTRVTMNKPVMSNRSNGVASSYAAKVLASTAVGIQNTNMTDSNFTWYEQARTKCLEKDVYPDPFLNQMAGVRGTNISNRFTYGELMRLDSNTDAVANFFVSGATAAQPVHHTGMTETWQAATREAVAATVLSQAVPAIMMDLMITNMVFMSTNHDITGQMNTTVISAKSFSNIDLTPYLDTFKQRFASQVLMDLTYNNSVSYSLTMTVDLMGDTWVKISFDGGPIIDFVCPSFADAVLAPVFTGNVAHAESIRYDFNTLVENIKEANNASPLTGFAKI